MNNVENAWFELGKAFSFLTLEQRKNLFEKLNLWSSETSTACRVTKDSFIQIANEIDKFATGHEEILCKAKELFAQSTNENIDGQEAKYYLFWGMDKFDLEKVMTFAEAAKLWGLSDSTLRKAKHDGRFEESEIRQSGGVWLVTRSAMARLYGEQKSPRE